MKVLCCLYEAKLLPKKIKEGDEFSMCFTISFANPTKYWNYPDFTDSGILVICGCIEIELLPIEKL